jgi:hypothetical protein
MVRLRMGAPFARSASLVAAGLMALRISAGCDTPTSAGASDAAADARHGLQLSGGCPLASQVAACEPAPGASCASAALGCAPDALPTGRTCSFGAQCSMAIDPCPDAPRYAGGERIDTYVCICVGALWSCDVCSEGAALCVESPDGSPYFGRGAEGGPDASADADAGPDADAASGGGADAGADAGVDASVGAGADAGADADADAGAGADADAHTDAAFDASDASFSG